MAVAGGGPVVLVLALAGTSACDVPHVYETREFSAPLPAVPGRSMDVSVRLPAGGIRLRAAADGSLYHATLTYCSQHTAPDVTLGAESGGNGAPERLALSLLHLPGVAVGFGGEQNEMRLELAPSVAQRLDLDLGEGESVLDLGGLALRGLRVRAGAGDARVVFSRPNGEAPDELLIEGTVGDIGIDLLGNSNAARTLVRGGVGTMDVDLTGSWRRDGAVEIEASVGDLILTVPADGPGLTLRAGAPWGDRLQIEGFDRQGRQLRREPSGPDLPTIDVTILAGIGRLVVVREGDSREAVR